MEKDLMKERIKFFQKEMNNIPYLNRHNTENKFNVSGEKTKKVEIRANCFYITEFKLILTNY